MEPTNPKFNSNRTREWHTRSDSRLDERVLAVVGGAIVACIMGILILIAIGLTGCSREGWRNFAEGYNEAHERNWNSDEWNGPARIVGSYVYDSNGNRALILGQAPEGPARVYTDAMGTRRMVDQQGQRRLLVP